MSEQNLGVIPGRRPSDFIAGTLQYQEVNPSGNWKQFLPPGEWQRVNNVDLMACVTFSLLNCIETQERRLTGRQVNYSDRWIAMMSNTTPEGNYLWKVADTVRKYGLVLEESWPTPENPTWDSYYAKPPPAKQAELEAEGQRWLQTHDFAYEWLTTELSDIIKHLKQCPLQVVKPGHAIEAFLEVSDTTYYFDSYSPFEKTIARTGLTDVLKPLLTMKGTPEMRLINDNGTVFLVGPKGKIGLADPAFLDALTAITDLENGSTAGVPQLRVVETAQRTFQVKDN